MQTSWYETFFRGVAVDLWRGAMPPQLTAADVDFLESELQLQRGDSVLDIPCGHGRHSIELARRGYCITGVDLSEDALAWAKVDAGDIAITWLESDMRQPPAGPFRGAFCLGNSFGYLSPQEASAFLGAMRQSVLPGGRFVIDLATTAEGLLPVLSSNRWFRVREIFMLSENEYSMSESRLDIRYTFIRDGVVETRSAASYIMTAAEIRRIAEAAGWVVAGTYSSLQREPPKLGKSVLMTLENPA